jgi:acylphosphatase
MQRVEVYFHGRVQGVGFRYATQSVAQQFPVTGFVRNEPDGTVYLVAEGQRADLEEFLAALGERMQDFIRKSLVEWSEATNRWSDFSIER